ncbi:zinc metalloprotease HtpX [Rubrobacter calidifluminis]|uniref:zinc metalloprotease HtpX n=1 Tax=Rubrobacter calidifluminis TaxID=1392640 RepID=UPI002363096F|nr:zinc metalloprotease HtpX [Rubrobacter calidifluminis]
MRGAAEATFRERIARNRRNSLLLFVTFLVFVLAFGYIIGYAWVGDPAGAFFGLVIAFFAGGLSGLLSYYAGDKMVLAASRARRIEHDDAPVLFNVVEEMAIAAGLPMPKVYVIDDSAPNAFATGRDPEHASVAVTSGLLEKLDRDELQGVIAHEMSHVRNLDIRYSMLVGILVGTTVLIADFFLRSLWWGGGRRRNDQGNGQLQLILMIVALILAILAPIFARLLQLSISRQREYLADASAVELTRNPKGLADALEKIAKDQEPLEVANRATAHLYIVNPIKRFEKHSRSLFSTHPPIEERIRILRAMETGGVPQTGRDAG